MNTLKAWPISHKGFVGEASEYEPGKFDVGGYVCLTYCMATREKPEELESAWAKHVDRVLLDSVVISRSEFEKMGA
jgi:hypothetical protein